jgi:hypothetical protein
MITQSSQGSICGGTQGSGPIWETALRVSNAAPLFGLIRKTGDFSHKMAATQFVMTCSHLESPSARPSAAQTALLLAAIGEESMEEEFKIKRFLW